MNAGDVVQIRQVEVIPSVHVPKDGPTGPVDRWIYAAVEASPAPGPLGVTVKVNHPANRWHRKTMTVPPADVRQKADVLALAATAKTPQLKLHYTRQAARLGPPPPVSAKGKTSGKPAPIPPAA